MVKPLSASKPEPLVSKVTTRVVGRSNDPGQSGPAYLMFTFTTTSSSVAEKPLDTATALRA